MGYTSSASLGKFTLWPTRAPLIVADVRIAAKALFLPLPLSNDAITLGN